MINQALHAAEELATAPAARLTVRLGPESTLLVAGD